MIYKNKPKSFNPWYHTVCIFIFNPKGEVLFLKRGGNKSEGGKFGIPGGKRERNESSEQTVIREIKEETGIDISKIKLNPFRTVYVKYPGHDFLFEMFETKLDYVPHINLKLDEHSEYVWVTLDDALETLPLVKDNDACIRLFKLR